MTARWSHKFEEVRVGDNVLRVRGLTYGERQRFLQLSRDARKPGGDPMSVPGEIVKMGACDLSEEDHNSMPYEVLQAAVEKIMQLSGLAIADEPEPQPASATGAGAAPAPEGGEKKA